MRDDDAALLGDVAMYARIGNSNIVGRGVNAAFCGDSIIATAKLCIDVKCARVVGEAGRQGVGIISKIGEDE